MSLLAVGCIELSVQIVAISIAQEMTTKLMCMLLLVVVLENPACQPGILYAVYYWLGPSSTQLVQFDQPEGSLCIVIDLGIEHVAVNFFYRSQLPCWLFVFCSLVFCRLRPCSCIFG